MDLFMIDVSIINAHYRILQLIEAQLIEKDTLCHE